MNPALALEQKIRTAIPLAAAMQFSIKSLSLDEIEVVAPLEPNINIHGTGFAGSIYSVAVLTGWALCTHLMDEFEIVGELVIGKAEISYRAPVTSALASRCRVSVEQREAFIGGLRARGKGKLVLLVEVGDRPEALLEATYVAVSDA
jgi:thioesterase domain-containing protein